MDAKRFQARSFSIGLLVSVALLAGCATPDESTMPGTTDDIATNETVTDGGAEDTGEGGITNTGSGTSTAGDGGGMDSGMGAGKDMRMGNVTCPTGMVMCDHGAGMGGNMTGVSWGNQTPVTATMPGP